VAKAKVPLWGTVGKALVFDPEAGVRAEAAVAALARQIQAGLGSFIAHSALQGLQTGDDHPQYTMWAAGETITATWNFQAEPFIEGVSLTEFIEDVVGGSDFIQDTSSITWTYGDTAGTLEANVVTEWVQDLVGAMLADTTSIDLTYNDGAGTFSAAIIDEYVQDLVGAMATDSTTIDFTYNDGAGTLTAAVIQSFSYAWTANHSWDDNHEVRLGTGNDLRLYHNGTNSVVENDTGLLLFYLNSATQDTLFAANTDWNLTGVTETPSVIADRAMKVLRAGTSSAPTFRGYSYGSTGSRSAPAALSLQDGLFSLDGSGYDGTGFGTRAYARCFAGEAWTSTAHGSYWAFGTTALTTASARNTVGLFSNGGLRLFLDNAEISLGAGASPNNDNPGDLRLSHDGTNSIIRNDTGILKLQKSTTVALQLDSTYVDMAVGIRKTNVISPAQLTANTDNWNPTGLSSCSTIRFSTDAARDITGIVAQAAGTEITLINTGTQNAVLKHDVTSTAANRFLCPGAADFTLNGSDCVKIWYDSTSSRWRVIAY
jgi:hypothetical protein